MLEITRKDRLQEITVLYAPHLVEEEAKILILVTGGVLLTLYCSHIVPDN